jgi:hypothetical protein
LDGVGICEQDGAFKLGDERGAEEGFAVEEVLLVEDGGGEDYGSEIFEAGGHEKDLATDFGRKGF